jgi:hypothetical protein
MLGLRIIKAFQYFGHTANTIRIVLTTSAFRICSHPRVITTAAKGHTLVSNWASVAAMPATYAVFHAGKHVLHQAVHHLAEGRVPLDQ